MNSKKNEISTHKIKTAFGSNISRFVEPEKLVTTTPDVGPGKYETALPPPLCRSRPWTTDYPIRKKDGAKGPDFVYIRGSIDEMLRRKSCAKGILMNKPRRMNFANSNLTPGPSTYGYPYLKIPDKKTGGMLSLMDSRSIRGFPFWKDTTIGPGVHGGNEPEQHTIGRYINLVLTRRFKKKEQVFSVGPANYHINNKLYKRGQGGYFTHAERFQTANKNTPDLGPASYYPVVRDKCQILTPKKKFVDMHCRKSLPPRMPIFLSTAKRSDKFLVQKYNVYNNPVGPGRYEPYNHTKVNKAQYSSTLELTSTERKKMNI